MAKIKTREDLGQYCLRQCGAPVSKLNISEDQVDDAIDDAIEFWRDYHYDGTEPAYIALSLTNEMIANREILLPDSVCGVEHVFMNKGFNSFYGTDDNTLLNPVYQMRLQDMQSGGFLNSPSGISSYFVTKTFLNTLDHTLNAPVDFAFSDKRNALQMEINWDAMQEGKKIIIMGTQWIDPEKNPEIYSDRVLRMLAAEYVRRQWGYNLLKFDNVTLPGGVQINGRTILDEANRNIEKIEQDFIYKYSAPLGFEIG